MPPRKRAAPVVDPEDPDFKPGKKVKKAAPKKKADSKPAKTDPELAALRFLLSDDAAKMIVDKDKKDDKMKTDGRTYRTAPGSLSPFEELVCAVVLAKPISHKLGVRSIAVLLNAPYKYTTPKALQSSTEEKRQEALDAAHTQHRQKTNAQLATLADAVIEHFSTSPTDTTLGKLREDSSRNPDEMSDLITSNVKGIGGMGINLFYRRLQAYPDFEFVYPFADDRSLEACEEFSLPADTAEELAELVEKHREALNIGSDEADLRKAYAIVLDRAVALSLERLVGAAKKVIAKA